jgi:16S rRNA (cytosine1402-N4)-methyltransferase
MLDEVLAYLAPRDGGVYCDATVGGGGHAERILEASSPSGRIIGIDRDPNALSAARARLARFGDRATFIHGTFADASTLLEAAGVPAVDGLLVDLGVSSPQLDHPERGFSFQKEGPLDMRMDPTTGESAAELIAHLPVDDLAVLLRNFGEERYARRIARAIKDAYARGDLQTTTRLAEVIARTIPTRERHKDPATRTFQALRIAVNDELSQLDRLLASFPILLRPGGRFVVISFHSLEDVRVKHRFRELARVSGLPPDLAVQLGERHQAEVQILTRKPVVATADEVAQNPRARSAKLRAAERL